MKEVKVIEGTERWVWRKQVTCCCMMWIRGPETAAMFGKSCSGCCWPLLWRIPILIWITATIVWSFLEFWGPIEMWFLYMTHWGLLIIFVQSFLGVIVGINSLRGKLLDDTTYKLPTYVKMYWTCYNMAIPIAFLITFFYWVLLRGKVSSIEHRKLLMYSPDPVLDYFIHAVNSVVMFFELITAAHPSRLLHIWQPVMVAGVYMLMGVAYYGAGGMDPAGNPWIYPMIDWSKPEQALLVTFLCAVYLCLVHMVVVIIATIRDKIARKYRPKMDSLVFHDSCKLWSWR